MNILKKLPLITIIILVIVSHVHSQCASRGGSCMNPNNCNGTVISGLCPGGNDNKCCVSNPKPKPGPKPAPAPAPAPSNDDSKCTSKRGTCKNPSSCNGTVISGLCPGGNDNKCCVPKSPTQAQKPASTPSNNNKNKCTSQGGTCKNPSSCNGTVISGLCPGGNDNKCCVPKPTTQAQKSTSTPSNNNKNKCTSQGGTCKNPSSCNGTVISGLCPGGNDNKCCIPKSPTQAQKSTSTPSNNNKNKCTSQGGTCKNPSSCNGTVISGLCPGGNDNKCCLPKSPTKTQKPASSNPSIKGVGEKCSYQGISGKCINTNITKCGATLVSNKCPGPSNVKCCLKKIPITIIKNDSQCTNQGGKCMDPTKCQGEIKDRLCPGGSNNKCCISKSENDCSNFVKAHLCPRDSTNKCCKKTNSQDIVKCSNEGKIGTCMDKDLCNLSLNEIVPNKCIGQPANIKCCIPKNQCVDYSINDLPIVGTCKSESECEFGYYNPNSSDICPGTNICCHNTDPRERKQDIIENLNKNLSFEPDKKKAMIKTAIVMLNDKINFDSKFIAGMLGNIQNEGTMGQFELTGGDGLKYCYQQCVNDCFKYDIIYSGQSISNIGIQETRDLSNEVYNSKNCKLTKRCVVNYEKEIYKNAGELCQPLFGLGIIQWTNYIPDNKSRKDGLISAYETFKENHNGNNNPSKDECIYIESHYLVEELKSSDVYNKWLKSDQTSKNAGYLICKDFIKNTKTEANRRRNNADEIYIAMYN